MSSLRGIDTQNHLITVHKTLSKKDVKNSASLVFLILKKTALNLGLSLLFVDVTRSRIKLSTQILYCQGRDERSHPHPCYGMNLPRFHSSFSTINSLLNQVSKFKNF